MKNILRATTFIILSLLAVPAVVAQKNASPEIKAKVKPVQAEYQQKGVTNSGDQNKMNEENKPDLQPGIPAADKPVEFRNRTDADFKLFKPVEYKQETNPDTILDAGDTEFRSTELTPQKKEPVVKPKPKMVKQND